MDPSSAARAVQRTTLSRACPSCAASTRASWLRDQSAAHHLHRPRQNGAGGLPNSRQSRALRRYCRLWGPSINSVAADAGETWFGESGYAGGLTNQVGRHGAVAGEALVVRLALEPAGVDLLTDDAHFEVREGQIPDERRHVVTARARIHLHDL